MKLRETIMERKIGQTFFAGYEIYEVIEREESDLIGCSGCRFNTEDGCCKPDIAGLCMANDRSDNTDVMFVSIGNVKQKSRKVKNRR